MLVMAHITEVRYSVTTPLFCEGMQGGSPEVRLPSFKGVLRFWWRALAWARYRGNLKAISEGEAALFGSAEAGQSPLLMRLEPMTEPPETSSARTPLLRRRAQGLPYLGYGVIDIRSRVIRACLMPRFDFTVQMRARTLTDSQADSLKDALIAMGTLGAMGARSRKGFGSLSLQSLRMAGEELWRPPATAEGLKDAIVALISASRGAGGLAEYTALGQASRHMLLSHRTHDPLVLLDKLGDDLKTSIGEHLPQRRVAFGLPRGSGRGRGAAMFRRWDRRASPLFIHIHECGGRPVAVISFLPGRFLPENGYGNADELYEPVREFLNGLQSPAYEEVLRV